MKEAFKISRLITRWIEGTTSQEEKMVLDQWVNEKPENKVAFDRASKDEHLLEKLSRWYDYKYTIENPEARNFHFSARINDNQDISTILDLLEMTTSVKFEIKDNDQIAIL